MKGAGAALFQLPLTDARGIEVGDDFPVNSINSRIALNSIFSEHLFAFLNISCLIEITFPDSIFTPSIDFRAGIKISINFASDEFNRARGSLLEWLFGIQGWEMHKTYPSFSNY